MAGGHKDYSGTPLWRKLGIREGARVHVAGAPTGFADALAAALPAGVAFLSRPGKDLDVVVVFPTRRADLSRRFPGLVRAIGRAGRLWVAWPTKASRLATDLDFAFVQRIGLEAGLVDNKTASMTPTHQGLQFVYRTKDRTP